MRFLDKKEKSHQVFPAALFLVTLSETEPGHPD